MPAAVGAQDVLDRTANGTFAAALGTLVVGAGLYFGRGIRRAGHKAAQRHGSQVVQVVAAVGNLLAGIAVFGKKFLQKVRLVGDVLVNIGDLQVGSAAADGFALAPGADHHADACGTGQHQPGAVFHAELFQLVAGGIIVDAAVGQCAVHVQHQ